MIGSRNVKQVGNGGRRKIKKKEWEVKRVGNMKGKGK
jgi:hypothetical protein